MHEDGRVNRPDRVSEPLQAVELMPLARLGLVDLELHVLPYGISAATYHDHHGADEDA